MGVLGPGVPGADGQSPSRGRVRGLVPQPGTRISLGLMENLFMWWRVNCCKSVRRRSQNYFFLPEGRRGVEVGTSAEWKHFHCLWLRMEVAIWATQPNQGCNPSRFCHWCSRDQWELHVRAVWASQAKILVFPWVFYESSLALCSDLPSSSGMSYDSVCDQAIQVFKNT